ncbi:MAG: PAS domain S-box protein, partial [Desulfocapsa sp.]|nr:PAS domain S-box protein [Desulfocapsa sp.]
ILWVENSVFRLSDGKIAAVYRDITERKRIEDELNHANNIINRSPVVAFLWKNEDGWPVQFVSENVVNLLGYTAEELTSGGISFDSLVHPDDYERVAFEVAEKSLQKDISTFTHSPYRFLIKNGETKWVHDTTSMRRDIHGRITHFEGIIYDISIQQLQQERINHLSNLRKTGLSIQRHLLSQKDNKELLQSICNVFVDEKGYRSAWIVLFNNKQDCRLTANAGLLKDFSELEQAIRDGNMPPCISRVMTEKRLIWKTSQQKLCAGCLMANGYPDTGLMAAPLAHDGQVYGVITVSLASDMVTDIEERELFEEVANDIAFSFYSREQEVNKQEQKKALQVALDEYADLYNNAPDMFVSVEAESARIQQCNKTLLDALGYERKDVIGQPVFMIYHPDSQIECKEKVFPTFCE